MAHTIRCGHSKGSRCRCVCQGRLHGAAAQGEVGTFADEQAPGVLRPDRQPTNRPLTVPELHAVFEATDNARLARLEREMAC